MNADTVDFLRHLTEALLPRIEEWEYKSGARYCPIPPTEQELDHYVRTGEHPLRPSALPPLRIW